MIWALLSTSLIGVAGLLYGLLERSKRQVAEGKASTISAQLAQEQANHQDSIRRYELLVTNYRNEILKLQKELDANLTPAGVRERLNDLLAWRVPPPNPTTPTLKSVSPLAAPNDGGGQGV